MNDTNFNRLLGILVITVAVLAVLVIVSAVMVSLP